MSAANPSAYTLYRDGATQAGWTRSSDTVAPNPGAVAYTRAALGRDEYYSSGSDYFDGALRDVRLYARALPGAEVAVLAGDAGDPPTPAIPTASPSASPSTSPTPAPTTPSPPAEEPGKEKAPPPAPAGGRKRRKR